MMKKFILSLYMLALSVVGMAKPSYTQVAQHLINYATEYTTNQAIERHQNKVAHSSLKQLWDRWNFDGQEVMQQLNVLVADRFTISTPKVLKEINKKIEKRNKEIEKRDKKARKEWEKKNKKIYKDREKQLEKREKKARKEWEKENKKIRKEREKREKEARKEWEKRNKKARKEHEKRVKEQNKWIYKRTKWIKDIMDWF